MKHPFSPPFSSLKIFLLFSLFYIFLITSCSQDKNIYTIEHTNLGENVTCQQNIILTFNKDICPDSLMGQSDTNELIHFTPQIQGKYVWISGKELMFVPYQDLKPCTQYKSVFTKNITKYNNEAGKYLLGKKAVEFNTPYPQIEQVSVYWDYNDQLLDVYLHAEIISNIPFNLASLREKLSVTINGKSLPFSIINTPSPHSYILEINPQNNLTGKLEIKVGKGLKVNETEYISKQELAYTVPLTPVQSIAIQAVNPVFDEEGASIEIRMNQTVTEEEATKYIKVEGLNTPVQFTAMPGGIKLNGLFNEWDSYRLIIDEGLRGKSGGELKSQYTENIRFGHQDAEISFANSRGMYMGQQGNRNINVTITNIKKVKVKIYKIFENNLNYFIMRRRNSMWNDNGNSYGFSYDWYDLEYFGSLMEEKEYFTKDLPVKGNARILHLPPDVTGKYPGACFVVVQSADENTWIGNARLVNITDIGIIARGNNNSMHVYVNKISDAKPVSKAKLILYSTHNQVISETVSDENGMAVFNGLDRLPRDFYPGMISAYSGTDFSFMLLHDAEIQTSRFDVDGYKTNSTGIMGYIYGDRDLYRPGETVHCNVVIRNDNGNTPSPMPVLIKVNGPSGQELNSFRFVLSNAGSVAFDFPVTQEAMTGEYRFDLYTANEIFIGSRSVYIEEFVPARIELSSKIIKKDYYITDSLSGIVKARNLFGSVASGRNYEYEISMSYGSFKSEQFPDYHFDLINDRYIDLARKNQTGLTDNNGTFPVNFSFPDQLNQTGKLNGVVYSTVFDETGRPVHASSPFSLYTQPIFAGIGTMDTWYESGQTVKVPVVCVNKEGFSVAGQIKTELIKTEYFNWMTYGSDGYTARSQGKTKLIQTKNYQISDKGSQISLEIKESGYYEYRIYMKGSNSYIPVRFSVYGYSGITQQSFDINPEGTVDITTDKKIYKPGESVKLLFKTPFSGRMWLTLEREKVMESRMIEVKNRAASVTLPVKAGYCPNVYISAVLFHPDGSGKNIPLTVAHGYKNISVEDPETNITLKITAVSESRSDTRQNIIVHTLPGQDCEVTIAVVDEGILNIRNTDNPNPHEYFYQKRALSVTPYDIYPMLMPEISIKKSKTGGGGEMAGNKMNHDGRVNPLANNRIKPVAFWSGILKPDNYGKANFSVQIPSFSGRLRIVAIAYKGRKMGAAVQPMTIADPVIISPAIPRFLSPGDTVMIPVTIFNRTKKNIQLGLSMMLSSNIKSTGTESKNININKEGEITEIFKIYSTGVGIGSIAFKIRGDAGEFRNTTSITIRPAAGLVVKNNGYMVQAGSTKSIVYNSNFLPGYTRTKLVISASPMVQFSKGFEYLIRYPHGCIEQTVSAVFPQLYLKEILPYMHTGNTAKGDAEYYIKEALLKLSSMQLYNGAFSYWPGGGYESYWGTIYATHFMLEAEKAGHPVNRQVINRAIQYISGKLKYRETVMYRYFNGKTIVDRSCIPTEQPYSVLILAMGGKKDLPAMNYLKQKQNMLTQEGRFLLAAAFAETGDYNNFRTLIHINPKEKPEHQDGGSFYSYLRELSVELNLLTTYQPENPLCINLIKDITSYLESSPYINTQEAAWSFMALGKYIQFKKQSGTAEADIIINGKQTHKFNGKDIVINTGLNGSKVNINARGKGNLYVYTVEEGIPADGAIKQEDQELEVRRNYFSRDGKEIKNPVFNKNDLIIIRVALKTKRNIQIENIAITDLLPAGFEIENTRITEVPNITWIKNESTADYKDIRDDRINIYTSANSTPRYFYYMVRCVSPGIYKAGPVSADAMYRGEYHSYWGAGKVIIKYGP